MDDVFRRIWPSSVLATSILPPAIAVDYHRQRRPRAIGQRAATLLANRIEQAAVEEAIIDIDFHLIERESA